ncbi:hypothetical protein [Streptomyces sp. NPDC006355]|uniref:hypothetical protein n=1 Tax=Streptomyces sp. NPDC006355 TaxID=3156758 RepID=UPI0033AFDAD0
MPRTVLDGIAPGTAVGDARSVDIDVQAPAAGACPSTWTIGARLTPIYGQVGPNTVNLTSVPPATITQVPGASVTLTEPGVYELVGDASGSQTVTGAVSNAQVRASLFVGASRISPDTTLTLFSNNQTGVYAMAGSATTRALYTVTSPTTVDLRGYRNVTSGTQSSAAIGNAYIYWKKVSD